jgi:hypothetical protein
MVVRAVVTDYDRPTAGPVALRAARAAGRLLPLLQERGLALEDDRAEPRRRDVRQEEREHDVQPDDTGAARRVLVGVPVPLQFRPRRVSSTAPSPLSRT